MIFWILIGLASAIAVFVLIYGWHEFGDWSDGVIGFFAVAGISAVVIGVYTGLTAVIYPMNPPQSDYRIHSVSTEKIVALSNGQGVQGEGAASFFVAVLSVDSSENIRYVQQDGKAFFLQDVDASESTIYQDAEPSSASVKITHGDFYSWVLLPWDFPADDEYTFHIPKGSIDGNFQVSVNQ